jgi:hypothetical protein
MSEKCLATETKDLRLDLPVLIVVCTLRVFGHYWMYYTVSAPTNLYETFPY